MVLVELDSDAILVTPMKNRTSKEMIRVYQVLVDRLKASGVHPLQTKTPTYCWYIQKDSNMPVICG